MKYYFENFSYSIMKYYRKWDPKFYIKLFNDLILNKKYDSD